MVKQKFCQFEKFVNDNELTRIEILTNMWLSDDSQHSFPVKTPKHIYLPSAKIQLEKDFDYEELNRKNKDKNRIISSHH